MFHGSFVTDLRPFQILESDAQIQPDAFPCFVCSRVLALGIDPTGMQGLDARTEENPLYRSQWGGAPNRDDLYVFHSAMKSNHGSLGQTETAYLRFPMGWIDYVLTVDGQTFDAESIATHAINWRREWRLDELVLENGFDVAGVRVLVSGFVSVDSVVPRFDFKFESLDLRSHKISLEVRLNFTLRTGEPIFTPPENLSWSEPGAAGFSVRLETDERVKYLEKYAVTYAIAVPGATIQLAPSHLSARREMHVGTSSAAEVSVAFYFGSSQTQTDGDDRAQSALQTDCIPTQVNHLSAARRYWENLATVSTGEVVRDWLYNFSLYLCDLGTDLRFGAGCCGNLVPWQLGDNVFWDSHYIVDGLLHAGAKDHAQKMIDWQSRVMGRDGKRPFYWMVHYTGQTVSGEDTGYTAIAGHGMTSARVAMYADPEDQELIARCNEILQNVAGFASSRFFEKTEKGWILSAPSATDITFSAEFLEHARNNTFTHVWFLSVFSKAIALAGELGKDYPHLARCREIIANYYLEQSDTEYLDQRDGKRGDRWDSYLPILCYPTEGQQWVDADKYHNTRLRYDHYTTTPAVLTMKMPWPMCWGAAGDMRTGLPDAAEDRLNRATHFAYGPGYFCESIPEAQHGTSTPYLSTCGAYLTAQSEQFFYTDYHTGKIGLFWRLGRQQMLRERISFARLHGRDNLVASGVYTPHSVDVTIEGGRGQEVDVEIIIPYRLRSKDVEVRLNGQLIDHERAMKTETFVDSEDKWRTQMAPECTLHVRQLNLHGTVRLQVVAAGNPLETFRHTQMLVYDGVGLGRQLQAVLATGGMEVCRVGSWRDFLKLLPRAKVALVAGPGMNWTEHQALHLHRWVEAGGRLILLYETATATEQFASKMLTGLCLTHRAGHRWTQEDRQVTISPVPDSDTLLQGALNRTFTFPDSVAFVEMPHPHPHDAKILYRDDLGGPFAAVHEIGSRGGRVLWLASGQLHLTRCHFAKTPDWQAWFSSLVRVFM